MPQAMIEAYAERLAARKAELALMLIDATALPHLKAGDQRRVLRHYEDAVRGVGPRGPRAATDADLIRLGIGVRHL